MTIPPSEDPTIDQLGALMMKFDQFQGEYAHENTQARLKTAVKRLRLAYMDEQKARAKNPTPEN